MLRDAAGTVHAPAGPAPRIVSLVPSLTELLFDLGLGARVVGRTTFCVHPVPAVAAATRVGGTKTVRLDRLAALGPTHALVNVDENVRGQVEAIAQLGVRVIVTHPLEPADNLPLYRLVGGIFGREAAARRLGERFARALSRLRARRSGRRARRALYLIWREPWMTVSPDTYISRMLSLIGWQTAGGSPTVRYPEVDLGPELAASVDRILLPSEPFPFKARHVEEVRALCAPAAPAVDLVDGEMLSWYGSRAVAGLDYLDYLGELAGLAGPAPAPP